ncbi:CG9437 [Drosophila busckii]|uniref:CG9437 n=2 Tax=Drosophila busckii TaxID=30019 RepID=A0A0M4ED72_DROBS|nr:CG9437 [Drosophila busckii]
MRLHPASDFGKNEFFRQMDFLREFVRKRRERSRRDDTPTSWLKSEVKKPRLIARPKPEILLDPDLDDSQNYEESEHNFDADTKLEVQTTQSESYSVLAEADEVDADEHVSYDDYLADTETAQQKPLPTLRPSPALVTVHTEAPTTTTTTSTTVADRSSSETEHTHADLNYMVCLPNMSVEREHLPAIKSDALSSFETISTPVVAHNETEDDFFCKSVAAYLRQLSRRHKIKAKVEMYQILEKYILIEEAAATTTTIQGSGSHN